MTWVVGATSMFGYGVIVSDVQVTCGVTGRRMDVLQKAFPVGKYIAAGFAGDVRAGLALLTNLRDFLNPGDIPEDECWKPDWVAEHWPATAKQLYQDLLEEHSVGPTHILMVGAKRWGTPEKAVFGGAIGHISVFRSPDFVPECQQSGRKVMSIGSGSGVDKYREGLEYIMRDPDLVYMKGEVGSVGGHGRMIAFALQMEVKRAPTSGISQHFHLFTVRLGAIQPYSTSGMPAVARSWPELLELLDGDMDVAALVARQGYG